MRLGLGKNVKIAEKRVQITDVLPNMIADEFNNRAPITHMVCSVWLEKSDGVSKVTFYIFALHAWTNCSLE